MDVQQAYEGTRGSFLETVEHLSQSTEQLMHVLSAPPPGSGHSRYEALTLSSKGIHSKWDRIQSLQVLRPL